MSYFDLILDFWLNWPIYVEYVYFQAILPLINRFRQKLTDYKLYIIKIVTTKQIIFQNSDKESDYFLLQFNYFWYRNSFWFNHLSLSWMFVWLISVRLFADTISGTFINFTEYFTFMLIELLQNNNCLHEEKYYITGSEVLLTLSTIVLHCKKFI